jgi:hypothetical protein
MPGCQRNDLLAMSDYQPASRYDQAAIRGACEGRDGTLKLDLVAHTHRAHLDPE